MNRIPITPGALDTVGVRLGVLAILVDVSGAGIALQAIAPDWIATADLSVHMTRPVAEGELQFHCRPLRLGARSVVVEAGITDGEGRPCGHGRMAFARIPGSATDATVDPSASDETVEFVMEGGSPIIQPITGLCGLTPVGPGQLVLEKSDYVRNSFGTINGGVLALAAEAAAVSAAGDGYSTDLQIHYLEQIGDGPVAVTAEVVRADVDGDHCLVRLVDRSNGALCAVSDVRVARLAPR